MFKVENIEAYKIGRTLSKEIWEIVSRWNFFAQKTIGEQLVRSTDSIAANIAEGFGRFHKMDKVKFYYNARASVYESIHWVELATERKLLTDERAANILSGLNKLPREINILIKLTITNLKK